MKKLFVFLCVVILLIAFFTLYGKKEDVSNRIPHIDDATMAEVQKHLRAGDEVVGALYTPGWVDWMTTESYDELAAKKGTKAYIIKTEYDKFQYVKVQENGSFLRTSTLLPEDQFLQQFLISYESVVKKIAPDITVQAFYAFRAYTDVRYPIYIEWDIVYLQTNKGNYTYRVDLKNGKEYLFPAKTFLDYGAWVEEGFSSKWDMSFYDIKSAKFDLNAPTPGSPIIPAYIWVSVVAVVIVLIAGVRRIRDKRFICKMIRKQQAQQAQRVGGSLI